MVTSLLRSNKMPAEDMEEAMPVILTEVAKVFKVESEEDVAVCQLSAPIIALTRGWIKKNKPEADYSHNFQLQY